MRRVFSHFFPNCGALRPSFSFRRNGKSPINPRKVPGFFPPAVAWRARDAERDLLSDEQPSLSAERLT